MGRLEIFATIPINGNVRGGLHAISSGKEFCVATCQDQIGSIDLTWFQKAEEGEGTNASTVNSTGADSGDSDPSQAVV
jgi:hypothetical protein